MVQKSNAKRIPKTDAQIVAQRLLTHSMALKSVGVTLLYAPRAMSIKKTLSKVNIIVSISKKVIAKATKRNHLRRQLRDILRQNFSKNLINKYDWMWIFKNDSLSQTTKSYFIKQLSNILHETTTP